MAISKITFEEDEAIKRMASAQEPPSRFKWDESLNGDDSTDADLRLRSNDGERDIALGDIANTVGNALANLMMSKGEKDVFTSENRDFVAKVARTVGERFQGNALGQAEDGSDVFLRDLWPSLDEVRDHMQTALQPEVFRKLYSNFADQNPKWNEIPSSVGHAYEWDDASTYIQEPPFFEGFGMEPGAIAEITGARPLGVFGDSVTTDHISPAGAIKPDSPAGRYLVDNSVEQASFNSYGSRRGNHEVMMRGTFANIRIRNEMTPDIEGGFTKHLPGGEEISIYGAAMRYQKDGVPTVVVAGKEYGTGSSRDWAAKGTNLLGVKAVIAESYERIHRSNLIGMGVLPLQFPEGTDRKTLNLDGSEEVDIPGLTNDLKPGDTVTVVFRKDGKEQKVEALSRLDTAAEVEYYKNGGILHYVLRQMM